MAWFKKKPDPISDRERQLNDEIAQVEAHIKALDTQLQQKPAPRLRAAAMPHQAHAAPEAPAPVPDPIFEHVRPVTSRTDGDTTPDHYNELRVRKYDLPALISRLKNHLRGPSTSNPKLVSYLAAGGIQGLRPLRYEKRVARNRTIALVVFLFLMLLGVILAYVKQ